MSKVARPHGRRVHLDRSTQRARALRREDTDAEVALWSDLRARRCNGWKFRRQVPVGNYIADFLCADATLTIELDGSQHADSAYDRVRDERLGAMGYRVLRFWNNEALRQRSWVLDRIVAALESRE